MNTIAFFGNFFPVYGGIEEVTINLANEFVKVYEVFLITKCPDKKSHFCKRLDSKVRILSFIFKKNKILNALRLLLLCKRNHIRLLICQCYVSTLFMMLCKLFGIKTIYCRHSTIQNNMPSMRSSNEQRLVKNMIRYSSKAVMLTKNDAEYAINTWHMNKNKIYTIPNFVDANNNSIYNIDSKTIVSVGRLDESKGFDQLIKAFEAVSKFYKDWTLEIYGSGPLMKELNELIIELSLENKVLLLGNYKTKKEAFSNKSMYVCSSIFEGLPLSLIEAQAYNLPIVSYDFASGPSEIVVNNSNGILVEPNNVSRLAEAILRLINNPEERISMSNKTTLSKDKFSKEVVLCKWNDLLKELLK